MDLIKHCLTDIAKYAVACYAEASLVAAIVCMARIICELWKKKKGVGRRSLHSFLLCLLLWGMNSAYVVYAFYVTLGMRYIGMRQEVNLLPFRSVLINSAEIPMMVENILLFFPFGVLFPLTFSGLTWKKTIKSAGLTSICIEILQFVFRCGKTELDDIILNIAGACAGYLFLYTGRLLLLRWKTLRR